MSKNNIKAAPSARLLIGIMYTDIKEYDKVIPILRKRFGEIIARTEEYDFSKFSRYYDEEMQGDVKKIIVLFEKTINPEKIKDIKIFTNMLEERFSCIEKDGQRARKINLDPGYLSATNLVLASTKNFSQRIYLGKGIFAELTLLFKRDAVQTFDWTYADYRSESIKAFFAQQRKRFIKEQATILQKQNWI